MNKAMEKVSIIIPTYNRTKLLDLTMYRLWVQMDGNYEVIILIDDDNTKDYNETMRVIHHYLGLGMPLKYFYTDPYKIDPGWCVETYPLNVGIKKSEGEIILINCAEVFSVTNTISQHRERQREADRITVISTVHGLNGATQSIIDKFDPYNKPEKLFFVGAMHSMYCGKGTSWAPNENHIQPYQALRPLHFQMSIKKKFLMDMGGFNEAYFGSYGGYADADTEFADRCIKYGLEHRFYEDIVAIHQWHGGGESSVKRDIYRGHRMTEKEYLNPDPVRNKDWEWGQFPRDMKTITKAIGLKESIRLELLPTTSNSPEASKRIFDILLKELPEEEIKKFFRIVRQYDPMSEDELKYFYFMKENKFYDPTGKMET
jgi:GT2 family glycosyltransferase